MGAGRPTKSTKSLESLVSNYIEFALLSLVVLEFIVLEFVLGIPKSPLFSWDESVHGIEAWKYCVAFQKRSIVEIINVSNYYPPFVGMVTGALFIIFGVSDIVARMTT